MVMFGWAKAPETSTRSLNGRHDGCIGVGTGSGRLRKTAFGRQDDRVTGRKLGGVFVAGSCVPMGWLRLALGAGEVFAGGRFS